MRTLDPRSWFRPRGRALLVDCGRVGCPVRGDTDLENCFTCGHMRSMSDGTSPRVICDYRVENSLAAFARRSG